MAKVGRPSTFTQEVADEICRRLSGGESLRSICRDRKAGMPTLDCVMGWLNKKPEFDRQYARARARWADAAFEEMMEAATVGSGDVQRDRLHVDTLKWALARMASKKYGDRVQTVLTGADDGPVKIEAEMSEAEASRIYMEQLQKGGGGTD